MEGLHFTGLDDPALLEYIRAGGATGKEPLKNMAVLRCVSLICESIGMLPLNLLESGPKKSPAKSHPAYRLLKYKPNGWQTPYEFKSQMQLSVLEHGDAYARVVWSAGRPISLIPLDSSLMTAELGGDYQMRYRYAGSNGEAVLQQREVFHLRDLSLDGICGMSRMRLAKDAISLARSAELAASRVFSTGVMAGGAVEVPTALSEGAYTRMKGSLETDYSGAENARRWMLLEEGAKANEFGSSAHDAQHVENRNMQIEEVARAFGVPRPLLMMDDTSWGSGIEQLGIFFVQFGLQHWFTAWEQAIERTLLEDAQLGVYQAKFEERALQRGTLKDQADYFAKALGAGGQAPWHSQNEVRELLDWPASNDPDADALRNPMTEPRKPDDPKAA